MSYFKSKLIKYSSIMMQYFFEFDSKLKRGKDFKDYLKINNRPSVPNLTFNYYIIILKKDQ